MRSRNALQTSVAETLPETTASRMAAAEAGIPSATDYARDAKETGGGHAVRRVGQCIRHRQAFLRSIVPLRSLAGVDVRRCGDAARVDRLNLLGVLENVRKLTREDRLFLVGEREVGKRGNPLDVGDGENGSHVA